MAEDDSFHEKMLRHAVALAARNVNSGHGGPFGAVVTRGREILAEGVNVVTANHDPTAHAEVMAIRAACRKIESHQLTGCTVYASCEPCPMCLAAIYWSRAEAVYFAATKEDAARAGFDDSLIYAEIPRPAGERQLLCRHVALSAAGEPFALWAGHADRIPY
jgi:guanine deaminase